MTDDLIGKEVDGYRIEDELGRGGMGVVYRAKDVNLSRSVAIKRINPSQAHREQFIHRFRAEAKALARIDSPHIVKVYALRETDAGLFIVMEYVDGGTLNDRIDGAGPVPFDDALPILRQILRAVGDAHSAGVIHRDLKPHNILLTSGDTVKITDFGIAKMRQPETQETVTQGGEGGTLTYMSPEQISDIDAVDDRSDLYSIGMVAYRLFAGRLPFDTGIPDFDIMRKVVEGDIPPPTRYNEDLPDPLVRWLMRAIAKWQDDRYQSANAMLGALEEVRRIIDTTGDGPDTGVNLPIGDPISGDAKTTRMADDASDDVDDGDTAADTAADTGGDSDADGADEETAVDETVLDAGDTAPDPTPDGPPEPQRDQTLLDRAVSAGAAASSASSSSSTTSDSASTPDVSASAAQTSPTGEATPERTAHDPSADASDDERPTWWMWGAAAILLVGLGAGGAWVVTSGTSHEASEPASATASTSDAPATLTLTSSPSGAVVYADDDSIGTTPVSEHALAAGPVVLRLTKPGHADVDTALQVESGQSILLRDVSLPDASDTPSSDDRATDDPATAEARDVESGDDDGTDSDPDAEAPEPTPAPSEPTPARLTLQVQPEGTVLVDGTERGADGTFEVPPGRRTVACRHPDHGSIDTTLTVAAGEATSLTCHFEQPLSITTVGPWGNVWIDGQNTDASTPQTLRLAPGEHTVELRITRSDDFRVRGGAYRVRTDDVETQRTSFRGATHVVQIRPGFQEIRHAIAFNVE